MQGQDSDDVVFVPPNHVFQSKIQGGLQKYVSGSIQIGADSADDTTRAQKQVAALLRDRHHIAAGADDDFSVRNLADVASTLSAATVALTALLAAIAAVSLLVGGIGIMNIMLVSVTERTREIGLRHTPSAYAKGGDILAQFLTESLVLALSGGTIGLILGIVATQILARRLGLDHPHPPRGNPHRRWLQLPGRHRLRPLSGAQSLAPRPHRSPPLRIIYPFVDVRPRSCLDAVNRYAGGCALQARI